MLINFSLKQITDRDLENNRVKFHYVGYPEEFDEWRAAEPANNCIVRLDKPFQPSQNSFDDRLEIFLQNLSRKIKQSLFSSRKESPETKVEVDLNLDVFERVLAGIGKASSHKNGTMRIVDNEELSELLGSSWYERFLNDSGDFCYCINGTVRFWMKAPSPVKEYKLYGDTFVESLLERAPVFVLTFVRGDGTLYDYRHGSWKTKRVGEPQGI